MASSDDEEELVIESVANYYLVDSKEVPIPFSILPILFDEIEQPNVSKEEVFLRGTGDGGLQKIYKQVVAWKLGLENAKPEVMVLTKDKRWINLLKPRKIYEGSIRTILITMQFLHFLWRKPESSEKSLWDHLRRIFSTFEDPPSVNDLLDHYPLIKMFVERDNTLSRCQLLQMLLKEMPRKKTFCEDLGSKKSFFVDDDPEDVGNDIGCDSEEEPELFDSVCAICDNGGDILCCEGSCMRSFHPTKEDGEDSKCRSLGFSKAQVDAIKNFYCKNCKHRRHQCFACGKIGSSDKSAGAEVFRCVNATCGHFYHPKCVAELLFKENKAEAAGCEKKIAAGESFACPVHKCYACKRGENREVKELEFAVCRRCPKSYHGKCLPRKIAFEDIEEEGIVQRAWEGLLPNRILIYCLKHKLDEDLGTPIRNHLIFPQILERNRALNIQKKKVKILIKHYTQVSDDPHQKTSIRPKKATEKPFSHLESMPAVRSGKSITQQGCNLQNQLKPLKVRAEPDLHKSDVYLLLDTKKSLKGKANVKVIISSYPKIDAKTENKMIAFMEDTASYLTLEDIRVKRTVPSTHVNTSSSRNTDKSINLGKVECSIEAVKTALQKLEAGGTVEDAKAVCEADIIKQILRWNNKLKVYLAPFLHGMRYTSFGRHFTKVDKLQEIADKLQWYVQSGDMIVDFCCGANDFSRLMKEKLDESGKMCSYKNYDLIQPKNDFNFEKKDWMTVKPEELPTGSQLIMGLNPPFGVKASLANKFIDKALTFKPKLIILIVPSETERLDRKRSPYDLIWEDCEKLSGKSFYLPGSVDANDLQLEQWNVKPPPLYLWSRPDWTTTHRSIALKQSHISQGLLHTEDKSHENKEATNIYSVAKISAENKKRSSPQNHHSKSKKRKSKSSKEAEAEINEEEEAKSKAEEEAKRKEEEEEAGRIKQEAAAKTKEDNKIFDMDMSISPPDTTDYAFETTGEYTAVLDNIVEHLARTYPTNAPSSVDALFSSSIHSSNNWYGNSIGNQDYMIPNAQYSGYNNRYARPQVCDSSFGHNNTFIASSSSYGPLSSSMAGPAMEIYAPWPNEMNVPRGSLNLGPGTPVHGFDSFGFVPGPQHQFQGPLPGSWLDD